LAIGDFEAESIKSLVGELFGSWRSNENGIDRASYSEQKIDGLRFRYVENPELEQATVRIKQVGIPFNSQDFWALRLANYIFGGGAFSSRLMDVVRGEGGKTYGINSWCEYNKTDGAINIQTSTRSSELLNTYRLIIQELDRITNHTITEDELKKAKSYYAGNIPLSLESPSSIANKILFYEYQGLRIEDLENQLIRMDNTTLEEVNTAASQYFDPDNYVLVVVGKSEAIRDSLGQIGTFDEAFYKDDVK
jgi:zinc protease